MLPRLETLLEYEHAHVIESFERTFPGQERKGRHLFRQMLKYLWISNKHAQELSREPGNEKLQFSFVMHQEMREIDEMWHNFILHTRDYHDFCLKYFGTFLHHQPGVAENRIPTDEQFRSEMEKYLDYIYENLGESTVREWFSSVL